MFAATAPTLAKGKGYDRELIKRMEDASGRPATTAATAFVDALTLLGAKKISIGAPWSKTMDKPMVEFMEASGFEVVHSEVVGFVASIELGRVGPETAYELGRRADRPDADAIIMPGGNWASMPVVERLENELGKPVLVNNAVSLWAGLRLLKRATAFPATAGCCAIISPREARAKGLWRAAARRNLGGRRLRRSIRPARGPGEICSQLHQLPAKPAQVLWGEPRGLEKPAAKAGDLLAHASTLLRQTDAAN